MDGMKRCPDCSAERPRSEFNRNIARSDGLQAYCKRCQRVRQFAYDSVLDANGEARATVSKRAERKSDNGARTNAANKRWRAKNLHKKRAHSAVRRAVLKGTLTKLPCSVCGSEKSGAHHESYKREHWLDVIWFCNHCHMGYHRKQREAANGS